MQSSEQGTTATIDPPAQTTGRQPWTHGQKPKGRRTPKVATTKRALKLSVDQDTYERLAVESIKSGLNLSELVDKLARDHCNNWVLHAKPGPRG
jgi:hypothetical protein